MVTPLEQHVHSFLEMVPLMAILLVLAGHWEQFLALFGFGPSGTDFSLAWKSQPLPSTYLAIVLTAAAFMELLPYLEELARGWRVRRMRQQGLRSDEP
ncbi:hypothetical protein [Niveispirillum sp. KHB5.9]|uniref:hypothetical protein n=1 Tax=Niveispirillum sp. KHB5.9 TaxID=3400269 RepID=UPI003A8B6D32